MGTDVAHASGSPLPLPLGQYHPPCALAGPSSELLL